MEDKYRLPTVSVDSIFFQQAFDLERLRGNFGIGSTPPGLLVELHSLFQLVMSVISARIEGNRTTIFDAIEGLGGDLADAPSEGHAEINNILAAMAYIDEADVDRPMSHVFIRELHKIAVRGLTREGDPTPGRYRTSNVGISQAAHVPPSYIELQAEMDEFLNFANRPMPTSQQMIHIAIAHHRFLWIHPFRNGNGRVSRLLSYAMIRKHGFVSPFGLRTVNPTAVFGNDREGYYASLAAADDLSNEGTVEWCTFFVSGIHDDMERLTRLQDFSFLMQEVLVPTTQRMLRSGAITEVEQQALIVGFNAGVIKAGDLAGVLPGAASRRSLLIRALLARGLLKTDEKGPRFYRVSLYSSAIGPFLVRQLDSLGYLPTILKEDDRR